MRRLARIHRTIAVGALALVVALVGILPLVDAYRCVSMGGRLASHSCCPADEREEARIDRTCCERLPARAMEARATSDATDARIAPAPLAGLLTFPPVSAAFAVGFVVAAADSEGRPPGERLHLLSTILRI